MRVFGAIAVAVYSAAFAGMAYGQKCPCTSFPIMPDPPCLRECTPHLLLGADEVDLSSVLGLPPELVEHVKEARESIDPVAAVERLLSSEEMQFAADRFRGLEIARAEELFQGADGGFTVTVNVAEPDAAGERQIVRARDIEGRSVVTLDGREVGDIRRVVLSDGQTYAIISHGGFLGIGSDSVAVPAERIGLRGEEVVLFGLSEEDLERLPEYNSESDKAIAGEEPVGIGRYQ